MTEHRVEMIPQPTKSERDAYFIQENEIDLLALLKAKSADDDGNLTEFGEEIVALGLNLLATAAHSNASAKGWYDRERGLPEEIALMHSELSEALEEHRNNAADFYYDDGFGTKWEDDDFAEYEAEVGHSPSGQMMKPEGIAAELGDTIIRIADSAGNPDRPIDIARGVIEKMRYNRTRGYRHDGKKA